MHHSRMSVKPKKNELIEFIAREFGDDVAITVWKEFQGEQPYIPMFPKHEDPKQLYIAKHFGKKTTREIAKDLGLSVRQVQKRLNKPIRPKQINLFNS